MKRRTFVTRTGAALGGLALSREGLSGLTSGGDAEGDSTSPTSRSPAGQLHRRGTARRPSTRIVVVGAGAFGGWTALRLAEEGMGVTLVDAFGPGSARATSGGDSRGLRFVYGDREIYTRWAVTALQSWRDRQSEWDRELMVTTGRISLYPAAPTGLEEMRATLDRQGALHELLDPEEIRYRWPQCSMEGVGLGLFEPEATAIRANLACRVVAEAVSRAGGDVRIGRATPPSAAEVRRGALTSLRLADGSALAGDAFVFACGSWLPSLFPEVLAGRISVPRRDVFFFGPPPGDVRFSWPNLPNFSEGSRSVYGFPDLDGLGFKVAPFGGLDPFDPDHDDRVPAAHWLRRAREYMALRFPAMRDQPLVHSRICQLENTADDHFIIDRHPEMENVWIAGGGSGHAFKHGPVLGDYVARRVMDEDPEPDHSHLWRLR
jgi:sarcosine oxidase